MKLQIEWRKISVLMAPCALGLLFAGSAHGALITYTFVDGAAFDGGSAPTTWTLNGLTITGPGDLSPTDVTPAGFPGSYSTAGNTNIGGTGLAINGVSSSDSTTRWEVGESWTFEFDLPVIFREIVMGDFTQSGDVLRATAISSFDFSSSGGPTISNPFGAATVLTAGTDITFLNPPTATGNGYHTDWWKVMSITVETVPEPSSFLLGFLGLIGFGAAWRRKRN